MTEIFISYKSEERAQARRVARFLGDLGYEVWWDVDGLLGGEEFADSINAVIDKTKLTLVLWSPAALKSTWVKGEALKSHGMGKLMSARIAQCELPIPYNVGQAVDLIAVSGVDEKADKAAFVAKLQRLQAAVKKKIGPPAERAVPAKEAKVREERQSEEVRYWKEIVSNPHPSAREFELYMQRFGANATWYDLAKVRRDDCLAREGGGPGGQSAAQLEIDKLTLQRDQLQHANEQLNAELQGVKEQIQHFKAELAAHRAAENAKSPSSPLVTLAPPAPPAPVTNTFAAGQELKACPDCPTMVVIPAGLFGMGGENDRKHDSDECPNHRVTFAKPFAMGKFPVTFREWDACFDAFGSLYKPDDRGWGRGERPVINVSWDDVQEYIAWLNERTGQNYRLPTEAEWEYAARAGTRTPFYTGETITTEQANFNGNDTYNGSSKGEHRGKTLPVGSFAANPWGLHDMHGNVWEWVADCWHNNYRNAPADGAAWLQANGGDCDRRVLRGGSWSYGPAELRAASRVLNSRGSRNIFVGFRLAQDL